MDKARYQRYVAIGDSSTEGLEDPDGRGGFRGWADRLAAHLDAAAPGLAYANLAVRGLSAAEIAASQLGPALAMRPDLATVVAGMNDLLRRSFDARAVAGQVAAMIEALRALGATVVTFTIPDVSRRLPVGRSLAARTAALNVELRRISAVTGARLLDLASYELAYDPRMWARDRIHGNAAGHERIGHALAHLLELPGAPADALTAGLPPRVRRPGHELAADLSWVLRYVVPWAVRRLRNRTTGHGRVAKRATLAPLGRDDLVR